MSKFEQAATILREAKNKVHTLLMRAPFKDENDRNPAIAEVDEEIEQVIGYIEFMETFDPDAPENQ